MSFLKSDLFNSSFEEEEKTLENLVKKLNCPFRVKKVTSVNGDIEEHWMSCDPKCVALCKNDEGNWSCYRLMNINYETKQTMMFKGVSEE